MLVLTVASLSCLTVLATGCSNLASGGDGKSASTTSSKLPSVQSVLDAGVVFSDRTSYLCWPFDAIGLEEGNEVQSIQSSCDCVQASVIDYPKVGNSLGRGLLIEFKAETHRKSKEVPAALGVVLTLQLANGSERVVTVNLLHTNSLSEMPQ
jgi:hypothetical protein